MIEAQKEQTFSLGITVTVGMKKTSSTVMCISHEQKSGHSTDSSPKATPV